MLEPISSRNLTRPKLLRASTYVTICCESHYSGAYPWRLKGSIEIFVVFWLLTGFGIWNAHVLIDSPTNVYLFETRLKRENESCRGFTVSFTADLLFSRSCDFDAPEHVNVGHSRIHPKYDRTIKAD